MHLATTYAIVDSEVAKQSEDEQMELYGNVFFEKGIRSGYSPASMTYLSSEEQRFLMNAEKAEKIKSRSSAADTKNESSEEPFPGYDDMSISDVKLRLSDVPESDVEQILEYEKANANRSTLIGWLKEQLS